LRDWNLGIDALGNTLTAAWIGVRAGARALCTGVFEQLRRQVEGDLDDPFFSREVDEHEEATW